MAQQTLPERAARLGRPMRAAGAGRTVHGVVLLLPGATPEGTRPHSLLSVAAMWPLARRLVRAGEHEGLTAHIVRYRCCGWNGSAAFPAVDARWAADEVVRLYGDVPVCLAGHGMGARAALQAADHPAVTSVLAISPWLPESADTEAVKQLIGCRVLIAHGTNDERANPDLSYRLAERAKKINRDVCRFEVHSDGHYLTQHRTEVEALAVDFIRGALFACAFSRPVTDAFAAPPPLGLRMPLAAGFGASLRH